MVVLEKDSSMETALILWFILSYTNSNFLKIDYYFYLPLETYVEELEYTKQEYVQKKEQVQSLR